MAIKTTIVLGTKLTTVDGVTGSLVGQDDDGNLTLAVFDGTIIKRVPTTRDQIVDLDAASSLPVTPSQNEANNRAAHAENLAQWREENGK